MHTEIRNHGRLVGGLENLPAARLQPNLRNDGPSAERTEGEQEQVASSPDSSCAVVAFALGVARVVGVSTMGAGLFAVAFVAGVEPIVPWTAGVGSSSSIVSASRGSSRCPSPLFQILKDASESKTGHFALGHSRFNCPRSKYGNEARRSEEGQAGGRVLR
jgi:hypothetical protein